MTFTQLKRFWQLEILRTGEDFSWRKLRSRLRDKHQLRFIFWWRLASYLYENHHRRLAKYINARLKAKYACDIMLGAQIGEGFKIHHHVGIVVTQHLTAGKNMNLHQNSVIGQRSLKPEKKVMIKIGNDFLLGANSCIIADELTIGDNVTVGAMTFINKNLASNSRVITKKTNEISIKSIA